MKSNLVVTVEPNLLDDEVTVVVQWNAPDGQRMTERYDRLTYQEATDVLDVILLPPDVRRLLDGWVEQREYDLDAEGPF